MFNEEFKSPYNLGPLGTVAANNQVNQPNTYGLNLSPTNTFQPTTIPGQPLETGMFGNLFGGKGGYGSNLQLGLGALQTVGGLWQAYSANKLAKESIGLQKRAYEENSANQKQSYNTALEDRIRSRYATEGKSDSQADSYIEKNRL